MLVVLASLINPIVMTYTSSASEIDKSVLIKKALLLRKVLQRLLLVTSVNASVMTEIKHLLSTDIKKLNTDELKIYVEKLIEIIRTINTTVSSTKVVNIEIVVQHYITIVNDSLRDIENKVKVLHYINISHTIEVLKDLLIKQKLSSIEKINRIYLNVSIVIHVSHIIHKVKVYIEKALKLRKPEYVQKALRILNNTILVIKKHLHRYALPTNISIEINATKYIAIVVAHAKGVGSITAHLLKLVHELETYIEILKNVSSKIKNPKLSREINRVINVAMNIIVTVNSTLAKNVSVSRSLELMRILIVFIHRLKQLVHVVCTKLRAEIVQNLSIKVRELLRLIHRIESELDMLQRTIKDLNLTHYNATIQMSYRELNEAMKLLDKVREYLKENRVDQALELLAKANAIINNLKIIIVNTSNHMIANYIRMIRQTIEELERYQAVLQRINVSLNLTSIKRALRDLEHAQNANITYAIKVLEHVHKLMLQELARISKTLKKDLIKLIKKLRNVKNKDIPALRNMVENTIKVIQHEVDKLSQISKATYANITVLVDAVVNISTNIINLTKVVKHIVQIDINVTKVLENVGRLNLSIKSIESKLSKVAKSKNKDVQRIVNEIKQYLTKARELIKKVMQYVRELKLDECWRLIKEIESILFQVEKLLSNIT